MLEKDKIILFDRKLSHELNDESPNLLEFGVDSTAKFAMNNGIKKLNYIQISYIVLAILVLIGDVLHASVLHEKGSLMGVLIHICIAILIILGAWLNLKFTEKQVHILKQIQIQLKFVNAACYVNSYAYSYPYHTKIPKTDDIRFARDQYRRLGHNETWHIVKKTK